MCIQYDMTDVKYLSSSCVCRRTLNLENRLFKHFGFQIAFNGTCLICSFFLKMCFDLQIFS